MLSKDVRNIFNRLNNGEINIMEAAEDLASKWDRETLAVYIFELYDSLNWYVEIDDTNNTKENEFWLKGKAQAMVRINKDQPDLPTIDPDTIPGHIGNGIFIPIPEHADET